MSYGGYVIAAAVSCCGHRTYYHHGGYSTGADLFGIAIAVVILVAILIWRFLIRSRTDD